MSGTGNHTDPAEPIDLTGQMLIAMPGMGDPRFMHSVVFVCAHSEDGAMGLIVNKPIADLDLSVLLEQLSISAGAKTDDPLHFGGPVEGGRGFVLHGPDYRSELSTIDVGDRFAMTATLDILEDIASGKGPSRYIMALGYSGWGPGQLEREIAENGWLVCEADPDDVFSRDDSGKWHAALKSIGVDARLLSGDAGHA